MINNSINDQMDMMSIEQLHRVVLNLSKNCFEIKKLCVTVLISSSTLLAIFTKDLIDKFIFVSALFLVVLFWLLDAQSYYYQDKIRARMKVLGEDIVERERPQIVIVGIGMPLSEKRENRSNVSRVFASLFNYSMFFYLVLVIAVVFLAVLFQQGIIQNPI